MSPITTHVLDTARGLPAAGLRVTLEQQTSAGAWTELVLRATDKDGRIADFLPGVAALSPGPYRLRFATAAYLEALGLPCFFPEVVVVFQVDQPTAHLHIPLLLSPYGYSTYRGT